MQSASNVLYLVTVKTQIYSVQVKNSYILTPRSASSEFILRNRDVKVISFRSEIPDRLSEVTVKGTLLSPDLVTAVSPFIDRSYVTDKSK